MNAPNDQPQYQMSSFKPVEPANMCVNMIYDPGPITQGERTAARNFINAVGGLERAMEVLQHMPPADANRRQE